MIINAKRTYFTLASETSVMLGIEMPIYALCTIPNASGPFSSSFYNANQREKMLVPYGLFPDMEDNFQERNSLGGDFDLLFNQICF
jgi:hypothetical protein